MDYVIELTHGWHPVRYVFKSPGTYRVPEDLRKDWAERALKEGVAKRLQARGRPVVQKMAAPETKDDETLKKSGLTGEGKPSSSRPRGRPRKKTT